jgi:hypothetical protein
MYEMKSRMSSGELVMMADQENFQPPTAAPVLRGMIDFITKL